jgi:hypothetical protein
LNFKIIYILVSLFLFGCGVKARPLRPPETAIQSYIETYTDPAAEKTKSTTDTETKK